MQKLKSREAMAQLIALICPVSRKLWPRVSVAYDDPATYFKEKSERLKHLGVHRPGPKMIWAALLAELTYGRMAFEFEDYPPPSEFQEVLQKDPDVPRGWDMFLEDHTGGYDKNEDLLEHLGWRSAKKKMALVRYVIPKRWIVGFVPLEILPRAQELAEIVGGEIYQYRHRNGKVPAKKT